MPHAEYLSFSTIRGLCTLDALYKLTFAFVFGATLWVTFIAGFIALATLPRRQFGSLQARTTPVLFKICTVSSVSLLAIWVWKHPEVLERASEPTHSEVAQAYALAASAVFSGFNLTYVLPNSRRVMFARHKLEREERKSYTDPGVSPRMKDLSKQFAMWHTINSLASIGLVVCILFHGLWLSNFGLGPSASN
ncbi:hypothetical protein BOTBODRAFT_314692 [Botryobasidium botryosum FD-172 SS1]|uniref:TMEM205-like domain-containing protein n=1 Tax=Botryobasidium botryosum (strain FD-172 SS1) TaxID=930990 RepID=A0A067N126_BOTB1|nr:hypothetical protein BOTBODRAFT_314692 [Botryobasidium botryosum FD-172 SS1]